MGSEFVKLWVTNNYKKILSRILKYQIASRFNVSVAEVGDSDSRQRAELGVAVVSNDRRFVNEVLSKVLALVESDPRAEVTHQRMEII